MSIVCNLQQFESSIFDQNLEGRRASVNGIFNEFLQGMNGGDNNLPSGNLINNILV